MKKILLFVLMIAPLASFAAPSVRVLGNKPSVATTGGTVGGTKITPAKTSGTSNANSSARLGTLRAKGSGVSGGVSGATSASRFPVITSAKVYNNVNIPTTPSNTTGGTGGGSTNPPVVSGDVDVDAIVNAVTNRIQNDYYNRNEVYNKNEVDARVTEINNSLNEVNTNISNISNNLDDTRFDAIRTSNPRTARGVDAPAGYVYIWVEE